jgi:hypothetical protein
LAGGGSFGRIFADQNDAWMLLITSMAQSLVDASGMNDAWKSLGLGAALIVLITVVAYIPTLRAGFIWDDDAVPEKTS